MNLAMPPPLEKQIGLDSLARRRARFGTVADLRRTDCCGSRRFGLRNVQDRRPIVGRLLETQDGERQLDSVLGSPRRERLILVQFEPSDGLLVPGQKAIAIYELYMSYIRAIYEVYMSFI